MNIKERNIRRQAINNELKENEDFFKAFSDLDNQAYANGAIPRKYKELTGLAISVLTCCDECVLYHLQECIAEKANYNEIMEAIKMGVIGGGSITYPTTRYAYSLMKEMKVI